MATALPTTVEHLGDGKNYSWVRAWAVVVERGCSVSDGMWW